MTWRHQVRFRINSKAHCIPTPRLAKGGGQSYPPIWEFFYKSSPKELHLVRYCCVQEMACIVSPDSGESVVNRRATVNPGIQQDTNRLPHRQ